WRDGAQRHGGRLRRHDRRRLVDDDVLALCREGIARWQRDEQQRDENFFHDVASSFLGGMTMTSPSSSVSMPGSILRPCEMSATRAVLSFGPQSAGRAQNDLPVSGAR